MAAHTGTWQLEVIPRSQCRPVFFIPSEMGGKPPTDAHGTAFARVGVTDFSDIDKRW